MDPKLVNMYPYKRDTKRKGIQKKGAEIGVTQCVVSAQGLTGSWYSSRRKNIHRAMRTLDMPLFTGESAASCVPPACLCTPPVA